MADYFKFTNTEPFLKRRPFGLSGAEIKSITVWQDTALDYDFSFHTMHTAGHPVYVCKIDDHGQRNMPKVDTFGKTAEQLGFVNEGKLLKTQAADALRVIKANLDVFKKLAKNYYEGVEEAPEQKQAVTISCKQCKADITRVKPGKGNKRVCPGCNKWN